MPNHKQHNVFTGSPKKIPKWWENVFEHGKPTAWWDDAIEHMAIAMENEESIWSEDLDYID
jgi:hypothetical protein